MECYECGEEVDDILALGRHINDVHKNFREKRKGKKSTTGREGDTHACPVCLLILKWTTATSQQLTVCPVCLTWYWLDSGNLEQPPPEKCVSERSGDPCEAPEHNKYYRLYFESLATHK